MCRACLTAENLTKTKTFTDQQKLLANIPSICSNENCTLEGTVEEIKNSNTKCPDNPFINIASSALNTGETYVLKDIFSTIKDFCNQFFLWKMALMIPEFF